MDYVQEFEYSMFLMEKMEEQSAMEHFVHECYILSEETMTIKDLKALNEATGIGQRIKDMWAKFMKFIKTVWDKFVHVMDQLILKDQDYLKKHEATIKNKPVKLESVEMQNYDEGIKRIANTTVIDLDMNLLNDKDILASKANLIDHIKLTGITGKDEEIFTAKCKEYFLGGEKMLVVAGGTINMTDLYNYCFDYKNKTSKILAADRKTFENTMNNINSIVNNLDVEAKKAEAQKKAAEQKRAADKAKADAEKARAEEEAKKAAEAEKVQPANSSAIFDLFGNEKVYSEFYNGYITEAIKINSSSSSSQKSQPATPSDGKKLSDNISTTAYGGDDAVSAITDGIDTSEKQKEISDKLNIYKSVYGTVFTSKMTSAEKIYKDYMRIIRAHVKSYTGDDETKVSTGKDGTDYRSELKKLIDDNVDAIKAKAKNLKADSAENVKEFIDWFNGFASSKGLSGSLKELDAKRLINASNK